MIPLLNNPKKVRVGHWHLEAAQWEGGVCVKQKVKEVIYDYEGLLHGFGVEGEQDETYCFALVEKPDGTFDTPSVTAIQLVTPTLSGLA